MNAITGINSICVSEFDVHCIFWLDWTSFVPNFCFKTLVSKKVWWFVLVEFQYLLSNVEVYTLALDIKIAEPILFLKLLLAKVARVNICIKLYVFSMSQRFASKGLFKGLLAGITQARTTLGITFLIEWLGRTKVQVDKNSLRRKERMKQIWAQRRENLARQF